MFPIFALILESESPRIDSTVFYLVGITPLHAEDGLQILAPAPVQSQGPAVPPPPHGAQIQAVPRERPNYRLRHTLRGHTQSVSAILTGFFSLRVARNSTLRMLEFLVCGVAHVL